MSETGTPGMTKSRRRTLPAPGARQLPIPASSRKQSNGDGSAVANQAPRATHKPATTPSAISSKAAASTSTATSGMSHDPLEKVREQEIQIAALTAQLDVARRSALEAQKKMIEIEGMEGSSSEEAEKLRIEVTRLTTELKTNGLKMTGLEEEICILKSGESEALKALQFRMESSKRRNESQAVELGRAAANIEQLQQLLKDKEQIIEDYKSMIEDQTSQLAIGQSGSSAMKAELESLKVFSAEQTRFVNNLNEENTKLVEEIRRLKKQAITRDKQLKESVELAKNALIKEKEKRTRLLQQQQQATGGGKTTRF